MKLGSVTFNNPIKITKSGVEENPIEEPAATAEVAVPELAQAIDKFLRAKCHAVIHSAAAAGAAAVASPVPLSEATLLAPVHITMVTALYKIYGRPLAAGEAKILARQVRAANISQTVTDKLEGLGDSLPSRGATGEAIVGGATAIAVIQALGWAVATQLSLGEDPTKDPDIIEKVTTMIDGLLGHFKAKQPA